MYRLLNRRISVLMVFLMLVSLMPATMPVYGNTEISDGAEQTSDITSQGGISDDGTRMPAEEQKQDDELTSEKDSEETVTQNGISVTGSAVDSRDNESESIDSEDDTANDGENDELDGLMLFTDETEQMSLLGEETSVSALTVDVQKANGGSYWFLFKPKVTEDIISASAGAFTVMVKRVSVESVESGTTTIPAVGTTMSALEEEEYVTRGGIDNNGENADGGTCFLEWLNPSEQFAVALLDGEDKLIAWGLTGTPVDELLFNVNFENGTTSDSAAYIDINRWDREEYGNNAKVYWRITEAEELTVYMRGDSFTSDVTDGWQEYDESPEDSRPIVTAGAIHEKRLQAVVVSEDKVVAFNNWGPAASGMSVTAVVSGSGIVLDPDIYANKGGTTGTLYYRVISWPGAPCSQSDWLGNEWKTIPENGYIGSIPSGSYIEAVSGTKNEEALIPEYWGCSECLYTPGNLGVVLRFATDERGNPEQNLQINVEGVPEGNNVYYAELNGTSFGAVNISQNTSLSAVKETYAFKPLDDDTRIYLENPWDDQNISGGGVCVVSVNDSDEITAVGLSERAAPAMGGTLNAIDVNNPNLYEISLDIRKVDVGNEERPDPEYGYFYAVVTSGWPSGLCENVYYHNMNLNFYSLDYIDGRQTTIELNENQWIIAVEIKEELITRVARLSGYAAELEASLDIEEQNGNKSFRLYMNTPDGDNKQYYLIDDPESTTVSALRSRLLTNTDLSEIGKNGISIGAFTLIDKTKRNPNNEWDTSITFSAMQLSGKALCLIEVYEETDDQSKVKYCLQRKQVMVYPVMLDVHPVTQGGLVFDISTLNPNESDSISGAALYYRSARNSFQPIFAGESFKEEKYKQFTSGTAIETQSGDYVEAVAVSEGKIIGWGLSSRVSVTGNLTVQLSFNGMDTSKLIAEVSGYTADEGGNPSNNLWYKQGFFGDGFTTMPAVGSNYNVSEAGFTRINNKGEIDNLLFILYPGEQVVFCDIGENGDVIAVGHDGALDNIELNGEYNDYSGRSIWIHPSCSGAAFWAVRLCDSDSTALPGGFWLSENYLHDKDYTIIEDSQMQSDGCWKWMEPNRSIEVIAFNSENDIVGYTQTGKFADFMWCGFTPNGATVGDNTEMRIDMDMSIREGNSVYYKLIPFEDPKAKLPVPSNGNRFDINEFTLYDINADAPVVSISSGAMCLEIAELSDIGIIGEETTTKGSVVKWNRVGPALCGLAVSISGGAVEVTGQPEGTSLYYRTTVGTYSAMSDGEELDKNRFALLEANTKVSLTAGMCVEVVAAKSDPNDNNRTIVEEWGVSEPAPSDGSLTITSRELRYEGRVYFEVIGLSENNNGRRDVYYRVGDFTEERTFPPVGAEFNNEGYKTGNISDVGFILDDNDYVEVVETENGIVTASGKSSHVEELDIGVTAYIGKDNTLNVSGMTEGNYPAYLVLAGKTALPTGTDRDKIQCENIDDMNNMPQIWLEQGECVLVIEFSPSGKVVSSFCTEPRAGDIYIDFVWDESMTTCSAVVTGADNGDGHKLYYRIADDGSTPPPEAGKSLDDYNCFIVNQEMGFSTSNIFLETLDNHGSKELSSENQGEYFEVVECDSSNKILRWCGRQIEFPLNISLSAQNVAQIGSTITASVDGEDISKGTSPYEYKWMLFDKDRWNFENDSPYNIDDGVMLDTVTSGGAVGFEIHSDQDRDYVNKILICFVTDSSEPQRYGLSKGLLVIDKSFIVSVSGNERTYANIGSTMTAKSQGKSDNYAYKWQVLGNVDGEHLKWTEDGFEYTGNTSLTAEEILSTNAAVTLSIDNMQQYLGKLICCVVTDSENNQVSSNIYEVVYDLPDVSHTSFGTRSDDSKNYLTAAFTFEEPRTGLSVTSIAAIVNNNSEENGCWARLKWSESEEGLPTTSAITYIEASNALQITFEIDGSTGKDEGWWHDILSRQNLYFDIFIDGCGCLTVNTTIAMLNDFGKGSERVYIGDDLDMIKYEADEDNKYYYDWYMIPSVSIGSITVELENGMRILKDPKNIGDKIDTDDYSNRIFVQQDMLGSYIYACVRDEWGRLCGYTCVWLVQRESPDIGFPIRLPQDDILRMPVNMNRYQLNDPKLNTWIAAVSSIRIDYYDDRLSDCELQEADFSLTRSAISESGSNSIKWVDLTSEKLFTTSAGFKVIFQAGGYPDAQCDSGMELSGKLWFENPAYIDIHDGERVDEYKNRMQLFNAVPSDTKELVSVSGSNEYRGQNGELDPPEWHLNIDRDQLLTVANASTSAITPENGTESWLVADMGGILVGLDENVIKNEFAQCDKLHIRKFDLDQGGNSRWDSCEGDIQRTFGLNVNTVTYSGIEIEEHHNPLETSGAGIVIAIPFDELKGSLEKYTLYRYNNDPEGISEITADSYSDGYLIFRTDKCGEFALAVRPILAYYTITNAGIEVTADITNYLETEISGSAIAASYDESGRMISVAVVNVDTINRYETKAIENIKLENASDIARISVFFVDSDKKPLAPKTEAKKR